MKKEKKNNFVNAIYVHAERFNLIKQRAITRTDTKKNSPSRENIHGCFAFNFANAGRANEWSKIVRKHGERKRVHHRQLISCFGDTPIRFH